MESVRVWLLTAVLMMSAMLGAGTQYHLVKAAGLPADHRVMVMYQDVDGTTPDQPTVSPAPEAPVQVATNTVDPSGNGQPPVLDQPVPVDPNILMWQTVLGVIASLATSFISRGIPADMPDSALKRGIALGVVCLLVAIFDVFVRGVFNTSNYLASFLTVAVAAIGFYKAWSERGLALKIEGRA